MHEPTPMQRRYQGRLDAVLKALQLELATIVDDTGCELFRESIEYGFRGDSPLDHDMRRYLLDVIEKIETQGEFYLGGAEEVASL